MINTKRLATIFILTTILITGGFVISPYAYSSGYNDDDHDDCEKEHHSGNGDDYDDSSHHSDDDDDDCEPDPCDCDKPDKFIVRYQGPGTEENPALVEIYKKTEKIGDKDPLVSGIEVFVSDDPNDGSDLIVVSASDFGKKKLGSNTGYRILWDIPGDVDAEGNEIGLVEIARIDIHTSCSKLLYIGQTFTDGGDVTLTVEDGTRNGKTSIPSSDPLTCEEDQKPTPMSSITMKKALTNDNNGVAGPEDFTVTFTDIGPDGLVGTADDVEVESQTFNALDASFSVEIPAGTYTLSERISEGSTIEPSSYTTVLIAGDTACPSMVDEPFKLKKGKHISCTIYNDDNFDGNAVGGDGIIFHRNTIEFMYNSPSDDPPGIGVTDINGIAFDCNTGPCITLGSQTDVFIVQDASIDKTTSLVVMNVFPLDIPNNLSAETDRCVVKTLLPGPMEGTLSFSFQCELIEGQFVDGPDSSLGKYRINYAVIDTLVVI